MAAKDIWPVHISRVWKTAPVPYVEGDPWYYNAVAAVETTKPAHELLLTLLAIEEEFGRVRTVRNAPRLLDLDLITYDDAVISEGPDIIVPHPRMDVRAFVLMPMADLLDDWAHPQTGKSLDDLIALLPDDQKAEPMEDGWDA